MNIHKRFQLNISINVSHLHDLNVVQLEPKLNPKTALNHHQTSQPNRCLPTPPQTFFNSPEYSNFNFSDEMVAVIETTGFTGDKVSILSTDDGQMSSLPFLL